MPVRVAGKAITDLGYLHARVTEEDVFDGETPKIEKCLERTLDASEHFLNDNDTVIFAAATLKRILVIFQDFKRQLPRRFWNPIILHIRRIWDYSADVVCYDAVETFASLLTLHLGQCIDCLDRPPGDSHANCDWINEITQWLLEPTTLCRARFKCIALLVDQCPTLRLNLGEAFFRHIYPLITNASFSTVVCQLIVDNIFDRDELWDMHCALLLQLASTKNMKLIKTRLIPMLQKHRGTEKDRESKEKKASTAVEFLNQLLTVLNQKDPIYDLQSYLDLVHALVTTTWPRKAKNDRRAVDFSHWNQCVHESVMSTAMYHVDSEVRLSGFRLIVENPRKSTTFNEVDLEFIRLFLDSNMTIQHPAQRHNLIASYKSMCQRIGASAESYLKKQKAGSETESDSQLSPPLGSSDTNNTFDYDARGRKVGGEIKWPSPDTNLHPTPAAYIKLCKWMAKLAFDSLNANANHYRRLTALMQIEVLFNRDTFISDGKTMFVDKLNLESTLGSDRHKLVVDCLDDSYESVQTIALGLLQRLDFGNITLREDDFLKRATTLMNSQKTRSAVAAGFRMQYYLSAHPNRYTFFVKKLIEDVREKVEAAEEQLMRITGSPLHPSLYMLELLLKKPMTKIDDKNRFFREEVLDDLLPLCHRIVRLVNPVVHSMSPEGYVPDEATLTGSTATLAEISQQLLVCCWRTHKHVSGMFSWMIEELGAKQILTKHEVEAIGTFYWAQLTECKHRGAFESATDGFAQLCKFLWSADDNLGLPKPAVWLDDILSACRGDKQDKDLMQLCSTRRSAGLPHLVVAILTTEPKSRKSAALHKAADSLLDMSGKSAEYRIHSLNVMKAIVQSAGLSERVAFCCETALRVAIDACRADWSERNAASQLFAALRTRIFGVMRSAQRTLLVDPKNRKSNYEFFSKFPTLYKFVFEQLAVASEFSLLPPLVLLTHLYTPGSSTNTELYPLRPFIPPLVEIAMSQRSESLRSHAVAAILAISDVYAREDLCQAVERFDWKTSSSQNRIHSFLMLVDGLVGYYHDRCRRIVAAIIKSLAFRTWCDFNINVLLILANVLRVEYDVDEIDVATVCLAKRPLAEKLLLDKDVFKTEMCRLLRDFDARRETYRVIYMKGWAESCDPRLCAHIITLAIRDLETCAQSEAKRIMEILYTAKKHFIDVLFPMMGMRAPATGDGSSFLSPENAARLDATIAAKIDDPATSWTLPSTMAYAKRLMYTTRLEAREDLIDWIKECFELDDPDTKMLCLYVAGTFVASLKPKQEYNHLERKLISAVWLYLADESEAIREKASELMGHLVKDESQWHMNPSMCRLLIAKWCLNDGEADMSKFCLHHIPHRPAVATDDDVDVDDGLLFDACAVNSFQEYALFGDVELYENFLGVNGQRVVDMYDIEY